MYFVTKKDFVDDVTADLTLYTECKPSSNLKTLYIQNDYSMNDLWLKDAVYSCRTDTHTHVVRRMHSKVNHLSNGVLQPCTVKAMKIS